MWLMSGEVIAEIDHNGRFVDLWVVVRVALTHEGLCPELVRRACRRRGDTEPWTGKAWRKTAQKHHFNMPQT